MTGRLKSVPWTIMWIASPVWRLGRELLEMRYLWGVAHSLDGSKLARILPELEGFTSARAALAEVVESLGLVVSEAAA